MKGEIAYEKTCNVNDNKGRLRSGEMALFDKLPLSLTGL